jgi:ATP-dependent phosphoenolpyruvate carboxykinase
MKYVYAVLTVLENKPIMQTLVSNKQLTGREILDKLILTNEEKKKYADWTDENKVLEDLNKRHSIRVEVQEVEV